MGVRQMRGGLSGRERQTHNTYVADRAAVQPIDRGPSPRYGL